MSISYSQALEYIYSFTDLEVAPEQRYGPDAYDPTRPARLLAALGNPHRAFPCIHIAGTKGKGSVAAICASVLREAGLRTGLYTSPHLRSFTERIQVNGGQIPERALADLVAEIQPAVALIPEITTFEVVTALMFLYFSRQQVDVGVIEVGLGGRLDATNVISPLVSVITSISYDHTNLLGETLSEIAGEKGGIIKCSIPVISAPQDEEALAVLETIAHDREAPLSVVESRALPGRDWWYRSVEVQLDGQVFQAGRVGQQGARYFLPLLGLYQVINSTVALAALSVVQEMVPALSDEAIKAGVAAVSWPGRFQILSRRPALVVDGAHNADSANRLRHTLESIYPGRRLFLILGITAGKDVEGIIESLAPIASEVILTSAHYPRAIPVRELLAWFAGRDLGVTQSTSVSEALWLAWAMAGPDDLICATGSLFVVGDALAAWKERQDTGL